MPWVSGPMATAVESRCQEVANRGFDYRQIAKSMIGRAQDLTPEARAGMG